MQANDRVTIIIPARYGSTRFPGKPLALIQGIPMIEHVYRRARQAKGVNDVIVATDDDRILRTVEEFGGKAKLTSSDHPSGTDRVAEVARGLETDIIINVQGDEPLIDPRAIEQVFEPLLMDSNINMATLMTEIINEDELQNPNVVKVVIDNHGYALYFSRSLIPFPRTNKNQKAFKHVGLYAYRKNFLLKLTALEQTMLEKTESLEQLRVLEHGYKIKVVETGYDSVGIDTPEQIDVAVKRLEEQS